jgi:acyl-homoserine lactone synthase
MIVILKGTQRSQQAGYFERMFRLRHQIFIKELGWPLPSSNGQEIDQYDVDDAVYFLDVTDDGILQASVRLVPSEQCSLVADYFPHLIETGDAARDPRVYECTRYFFLPLKGHGRDNHGARVRVLAAMIEWGLVKRLSYIQCVVDMTAFPGFVEMVPQTIPLGLAHPYGGGRSAPGGGECIAFRWPVTRDVVDSLRAFGRARRRRFAGEKARDLAEPIPGHAGERSPELMH